MFVTAAAERYGQPMKQHDRDIAGS